MGVRWINHNFSGGEVSPQLYARDDIERYQQSLKLCRNMYPVVHGSVKNRAGTCLIGNAHYKYRDFFPSGAAEPVAQSHLLPFEFNDDQTYVLEFSTAGWCNVLTRKDYLYEEFEVVARSGTTITLAAADMDRIFDGQKVVARSTDPLVDDLQLFAEFIYNGTPASVNLTAVWFEVSAPNPLRADTWAVRFTATAHGLTTGDRLLFSGLADGDGTDPDNAWLNDRTFKVVVIDPNTIEIDQASLSKEDGVRFVVGGTPSSPAVMTQGSVARVHPTDVTFSDLPAGTSDCVLRAHVGFRHPYTDIRDLRALDWAGSGDTLTISSINHPPQIVRRGVTEYDWTIERDRSTPSSISKPLNLTMAVGAGANRLYRVTAVDAETGDEGPPSDAISHPSHSDSIVWETPVTHEDGEPLRYFIYAEGLTGTGGGFGLIGASDTNSFDLGPTPGITPESKISPPKSTSRFTKAGDHPSAVTFFQERIFYGGTANVPQGIWGSATSSYRSFYVSIPVIASDAIDAALAGREVNPIQYLIGAGDLYIMTSAGVWVARGEGEQNTLTPTGGFSAHEQSTYGTALVRPLRVGEVILYLQSDRRAVRDLSFTNEVNRHVASDITVLAKHLFGIGSAVIDWAYAKAPDSVVWAVREDGTMISLTSARDHSVFGWARHDTKGQFHSVAAIRDNGEDVVYMVTKRKTNVPNREEQYVEYMHSREIEDGDVRNAFFVDAGLSWDGRPKFEKQTTATTGGAVWSYAMAVERSSDLEIHKFNTAGQEVILTPGKDWVVDIDAKQVTLTNALAVGEYIEIRHVGFKYQITEWAGAIGFTHYEHGLSNGDPIIIRHTKLTDDGEVGPGEYNNLRCTVSIPGPKNFFVLGPDGVPLLFPGGALNPDSNYIDFEFSSPAEAIIGFDHLDGLDVQVLADGDVVPNQTVGAVNGRPLDWQPGDPTNVAGIGIELPNDRDASRIHAGLAYDSDIELLEPSVNLGQGTSQTQPKLPSEIFLKVIESRGGYMGTSRDTLTEIKQRDGLDLPGQPIRLRTGKLAHQLDGGWEEGMIFYRQSDPLPVEIASIVYKIEVGRA